MIVRYIPKNLEILPLVTLKLGEIFYTIDSEILNFFIIRDKEVTQKNNNSV